MLLSINNLNFFQAFSFKIISLKIKISDIQILSNYILIQYIISMITLLWICADFIGEL